MLKKLVMMVIGFGKREASGSCFGAFYQVTLPEELRK
ncbi:MAG: cyclic lactone autoinducer peptide [bacterium]